MNWKHKIFTHLAILMSIFGVFNSSCNNETTDPKLIATSIELIFGEEQIAVVEKELANPIEVLVKDQNGDALSGTIVNFKLTEGFVSSESETTDINGKASISWTLGVTVGTQTLTITAYKADNKTALTGSPFVINASAVAKIVTDINGNKYNTITIGNQVWMKENLKTTKYTDNTEIPTVLDNETWANLTTPAYCWYDNDETTYADTYGTLYNWYAVETNKLCPTGWHVPSESEWTELTDYLVANGYTGTEGKALCATIGWSNGANGTDNYSFAALPGGYRGYGTFDLVGRYGYWWSSTEYSPAQARLRIIMDLNDLVLGDYNNKKLGFSVRCLKD